MTTPLTTRIRMELLAHGANLVGFGDLSELLPEVRGGLSVGIAVAVKYPKDTIRGIHHMPTEEYYNQYNILNEKLDTLVEFGAELLRDNGFTAFPQTRAFVNQFLTGNSSLLPHKTVATRAGLGWIGKCALLVTEEYGSMIRLSSILTDAPLTTSKPINMSRCGDCRVCADICPAGAISGNLWKVGIDRDRFFDAALCRKTARERTMQSLQIELTLCGKCIEICPYTVRYLKTDIS